MIKVLWIYTGLYFLSGLLFAQSDGLPRGAYQMPYHRYEAEDASLSGSATLYSSPEFQQENIASEASGQKYVGLPSDSSSVSWTMLHSGDGLTIRFTMPDSSGGEGLNGSLDLYIDSEFIQTVELSSYWAWQYFPDSDPINTPDDKPRMKFDEVHILLDSVVEIGEALTLIKTNSDTLEYGIDFIEIETVDAPISKPAGYFSVTDYGAIADDEGDDYQAFVDALGQASIYNTGVYIPAGRFKISRKWHLWPSTTNVTGAGIWYTEVYFSTEAISGGGIYATGATVDIGHFYMNTINDQRFINGNYVNYKGLSGHYGSNSSIHDLWITHFETGAWIADYTSPISHTEHLTFTNNRVRNNYADGINLSQGTSYSTVSHCDFRSNGDDAMAVWPSDGSGAQMGVNNEFAYNTVEMNYRAGGVAIFGGDGHQVHHLLIKDGLGSSGLRLTTDFSGYHFENTEEIKFYEITVMNCGTSYDLFGNHRASIDLKSPTDPISNIVFENIDLLNSQRHAVQISGEEVNVTLDNVSVDGAGLDPYDDSNFTVGKEGTALFSSAATGMARLIDFTYDNIELDTAFYVVNGGYSLLFVDEEAVEASENRTFYLDFGPDDGTNGNNTSNHDSNEKHWSNINNTTSGSIFSLLSTDSTQTSVEVEINAGSASNGILNGGLLNPADSLLDSLAINTATQDYFYTTGSTSFTFSNLEEEKMYTFQVFGSRDTNTTRVSGYVISGLQIDSTLLQTSGTDLGGVGIHGNNSNVSVLGPVKPDASGEIELVMYVDQGGFAYINLMTISESQAPEHFYVDLGPDDVTNGNNTSSPDLNDHYWNNWNDNVQNNSMYLNNHFGQTGSLQLVNNTSFSKNGILTGGLLFPEADSLGDLAIATATQDYFYVTTSGTLELSGLDTNKAYRFTLFGSRNTTQTRSTIYTLSGSNSLSGILQTSGTDLGGSGDHGNISSTYSSGNVFPTSEGVIEIELEVEEGGFAYLNCMKIETVNQPQLIWSASSWSNGRGAHALLDATINDTYNTATNGTLEVRNLTVNENKTLTVGAGTYLVVNGDVLNKGEIIVESGGTLISYAGNDFSGNQIKIKRDTRYADGKYSFVGSPITESNQNTGSGLGRWVYKYDESIAYETDGLERWQSASVDILEPGRGYAQAGQQELVFTGIPNSGTINYQGSFTSRDSENDGWNLVSNPYTAAISVAAFVEHNNHLSGAVYIWDDSSSDMERGTNGDYIVANSIAVTQNSRSANSERYNGYIGSAQGFFVQITDPSSTDVIFTESMRATGNNLDDNFFRSTSETIPLLRINLTNANGLFRQTVIGFVPDTDENMLNSLYDAQMFDVNADVAIFTLKSEKRLSIQGVDSQYDDVPLGMKVNEPGTYELAVKFENIENTGWLLWDILKAELIDLSEGNHVFNIAHAGTFLDRFTLVRVQVESLNNMDDSPQVYVSNKVLYLKDLDYADIEIYNLSGKKELEILNNQSRRIPLGLPNGVYLIRYNDQVVKVLVK